MDDLKSEIASFWLLITIVMINVISPVTKRLLTILAITHMMLVGVKTMLIDPTSSSVSWKVLDNYSDQCGAVSPQVTRMLLLLAGDVESNPGPVTPTADTTSTVVDSLTQALATIIGQAPSSEVRLLISTWAPEKTTIAADLNKFQPLRMPWPGFGTETLLTGLLAVKQNQC